jgi:hypothetical protein
MPILRIPLSFVALGAAVANGQSLTDIQPEAAAWDVSLPASLMDVATVEPVQSLPLVFSEVVSSHTTEQFVTEASPDTSLPPVAGRINVTLQVVAPPGFPEPVDPLPALPPDDPQVQARLAGLSQTHRGTELAFVSATVYDGSRTLLRIYPNGQAEQAVSAWSNLDFNAFIGYSTYRIDHEDGTHEQRALLMGIGNIKTETMRALLERNGKTYQAPSIPALPDFEAHGPAFVVVEGSEDAPAMDTLEQLHDLFRKEGARMKVEQAAREQAEAARRAELLATPPTPADVTIRYWKGEAAATGTEVAE